MNVQFRSGAEPAFVVGGGGGLHALSGAGELGCDLGQRPGELGHAGSVSERTERVAERHVPRPKRLNLGIEVHAASLEPHVAVGHLRERRQRLRGPSHPRGAGDQSRNPLPVHRLR